MSAPNEDATADLHEARPDEHEPAAPRLVEPRGRALAPAPRIAVAPAPDRRAERHERDARLERRAALYHRRGAARTLARTPDPGAPPRATGLALAVGIGAAAMAIGFAPTLELALSFFPAGVGWGVSALMAGGLAAVGWAGSRAAWPVAALIGAALAAAGLYVMPTAGLFVASAAGVGVAGALLGLAACAWHRARRADWTRAREARRAAEEALALAEAEGA